VRIELQHNQVTVVLHAFTEKEAVDCFGSLRQHISSLKIVNYIEVTLPELKFLQIHKPDLMKAHNVQVENFAHSSPKLKLEGMKSQVEKSSKHINSYLSTVVTKSHKCIHNNYLLMWKKCWQAVNDEISTNKELFVELTTSVSGETLTCEIVVVGDLVWRVDSATSSAKRIDGSVRECVIPTDRMGVKLLKEGVNKVKKGLIFHCEAKDNEIVIVSPYCTHVEEVSKTIEAFICSEKDKRTIVKKLFEVKYLFLTKTMLSQWNEVLEIAKNNKILSVKPVTDPCGGIEVKGTEATIKQAEPHFLKYISSLESDITCSEVSVDYLSRPVLRSPEFIQLCKDLQSDLPVSLTVQFQPEVLSSASIPGCDTTVEICEGSIALENSDVFINFTDENLTMSKELKEAVSDTAVVGCELHVKCHGPQPAGKAVSFNFGQDNGQKVIHAVLPKWVDGNSGEDDDISSAVTDCLKVSESCNAASVSLAYISYTDKSIPIDSLAKACLNGVHDICIQSCSIEKLRIVLPADMAKKFQSEFMSGLFQQWITTTESSRNFPSVDAKETPNSMWLWKDDDGKYYFYQPEDNKILNQKSLTSSSCNLRIGRFDYVVDFSSMTQTNTRTDKVRTIKHVTSDHVWMFKNDMQKWELFSQHDSMKIEAIYVTGARHSLTINGQRFTFQFSHKSSMMQFNEDTCSMNAIKRVPVKESLSNSSETSSKASRILINASPIDAKEAEEKLKFCIKTLSTTKSIDVQLKMVPTLDKHIKQIQEDFRVEITASSASSEGPVKYNITGYKECVQDAFTAVYQVLTTTTSTPVQTSFPKPAEWELQTDPIELKQVCEGSPEWTKILNRMRETIPYVELVSIDRIQNEFLWEKYCQHKERINRKGSERVNEMELFHGSSSTAPEEIYKSEEGFDMRFSRQGMWGQGNYFAESAKYSYRYAYGDSVHSLLYRSEKKMFLAKVLTGDSYYSSSDQSLRMPPYKSSISSEKIRYDTVNGVAHGSKIYITYSNDKAYPLYLISFRQN